MNVRRGSGTKVHAPVRSERVIIGTLCATDTNAANGRSGLALTQTDDALDCKTCIRILNAQPAEAAPEATPEQEPTATEVPLALTEYNALPTVCTRSGLTEPRVHEFDSTEEAYDASQWSADIKDGDILFVADEAVVGFFYKAWPIAVTVKSNEFHRASHASNYALDQEEEFAPYALSIKLARKLAHRNGFAYITA